MDLVDAVKLWDVEPGWLNTASYGVPPRLAVEALEAPLDEWRRGARGWDGWDANTDRARAAFARLVNAPPQDITVGAAASQILAPVAASLPKGARVLAPDIEHTSTLFPWLANDLDVCTAPPAQLPDAINDRTDAVAFSLVQSATGEVAPIDDIVAAARAHNALLVADATQAAGWLPVNATLFDVVVVSAYKWLMCPRGTAFGYMDPSVRDRIRPIAANWYAGDGNASYGPPLRLAKDARRFDIAVPWFSYVAAAPTLDLLLEIGVDQIHDHNVRLANRFRAGLGMPASDSAFTTVTTPHASELLTAAGIRMSPRNGGARVAFHLYTTEAEVDAALTALTPPTPLTPHTPPTPPTPPT
ncbi:aminotransferase class V-fold PLP-dependent enzyme [Actinomadura barringtoniae]|uniref:Aminotransferase class V-fold PLP-dependent enzyme n=1 Tax=Actinomadura barringtoniae TaxID=1427535 RepID=A0A939PKZ1_9ACTN|nr:aminotransferase class V-fold PLP-dependent enzyme [Actinomadura barringtoniae]MBO2451799.1 aminotransferase class V-fold PLP-dependent enzyme [Actinomadura barringtoniae]